MHFYSVFSGKMVYGTWYGTVWYGTVNDYMYMVYGVLMKQGTDDSLERRTNIDFILAYQISPLVRNL
jgi:hypothetical protein